MVVIRKNYFKNGCINETRKPVFANDDFLNTNLLIPSYAKTQERRVVLAIKKLITANILCPCFRKQ